MICSETCPRGLSGCAPLSNIVSTHEDGSEDPHGSIVCVGIHSDKKSGLASGDRFRHCFRSGADTDTMYDYDDYDMQSTISVFAEALLIDRHIEIKNK